MWEYLNSIKVWQEDVFAVLLSKIGVIGYPIIREFDGLSRPVAVIVNDAKTGESFINEISNFGTCKMVPLGLPKREFICRMKSVEYELMPLVCNQRSRQCLDNLSLLMNAMISGEIDGQSFDVLPMVVFVGGIPAEYTDYFADKIVIEKSNRLNIIHKDDAIVEDIIHTIGDNMLLIRQRMKVLDDDIKNDFLRFSTETLRVLIECAQDEEPFVGEEIIKNLDEELEKLWSRWEVVYDYSYPISCLQKLFLNGKSEISRVHDREDIIRDGQIRLENV